MGLAPQRVQGAGLGDSLPVCCGGLCNHSHKMILCLLPSHLLPLGAPLLPPWGPPACCACWARAGAPCWWWDSKAPCGACQWPLSTCQGGSARPFCSSGRARPKPRCARCVLPLLPHTTRAAPPRRPAGAAVECFHCRREYLASRSLARKTALLPATAGKEVPKPVSGAPLSPQGTRSPFPAAPPHPLSHCPFPPLPPTPATQAFKGLKSVLMSTILSALTPEGTSPLLAALRYPITDPRRPPAAIPQVRRSLGLGAGVQLCLCGLSTADATGGGHQRGSTEDPTWILSRSYVTELPFNPGLALSFVLSSASLKGYLSTQAQVAWYNHPTNASRHRKPLPLPWPLHRRWQPSRAWPWPPQTWRPLTTPRAAWPRRGQPWKPRGSRCCGRTR